MLASLFVARQDTKITRLQLRSLHKQNLRSSLAAVATGGPVVSMTTYGKRYHTVYLALESIAAGYRLPSRLILWLDDMQAFNNRPPAIRRLEARGLEVYLTDNYGPHKKYYPYLLSADSIDGPLVTADDDVLYSRWWLAGLINAHDQRPDAVTCYRAHVMELSQDSVKPYLTWKACHSSEPRFSPAAYTRPRF
jgi:hypothetical protein